MHLYSFLLLLAQLLKFYKMQSQQTEQEVLLLQDQQAECTLGLNALQKPLTPRCPGESWWGWLRGWRRSARLAVCTAGRSCHSGRCSGPSPLGPPAPPCPRRCGSSCPLKETAERVSDQAESRACGRSFECVPIRRGL